MDMYNDDYTPHRKKSKTKVPKKSDHKHDFELVEITDWKLKNWFTHKQVCSICGKEGNQLKIT